MRPAGRLDHERGPQRLVAVDQPARRPVPRRHQRDGDVSAELDPLVPVIGLGADRRVVSLHDGVVAERRDDARPMRGREARQRLGVEMVVVAMRDQHDVDRRQRVEGDAGIVDALRPGEAHRRDALRPDRIDQDVAARRSAAAASRGPHRRCAIPAPRRARAAGRCRGSAPMSGHSAFSRPDTSAARSRGSSAASRADRRSACRRNDPTPARRSSAPRPSAGRTRPRPRRRRRIRQTCGGG